jgi:hypothetical protein
VRRGSLEVRRARLEARRLTGTGVSYSHPELSEAWWQEFWAVAEASGYLLDILRAVSIPETALAVRETEQGRLL